MITKLDKERLVDKILGWMVYDTPNKPGAFIKKWVRNDRDKEILKELKAEDFNHRIR